MINVVLSCCMRGVTGVINPLSCGLSTTLPLDCKFKLASGYTLVQCMKRRHWCYRQIVHCPFQINKLKLTKKKIIIHHQLPMHKAAMLLLPSIPSSTSPDVFVTKNITWTSHLKVSKSLMTKGLINPLKKLSEQYSTECTKYIWNVKIAFFRDKLVILQK